MTSSLPHVLGSEGRPPDIKDVFIRTIPNLCIFITWQAVFDLCLQRAGGRLGQEGVGVPPEEVWREGKGKRQSVHAVGQADRWHLHLTGGSVLAASLDLGEAARTLARDAETSSEEVCQTPGTLKIENM